MGYAILLRPEIASARSTRLRPTFTPRAILRSLPCKKQSKRRNNCQLGGGGGGAWGKKKKKKKKLLLTQHPPTSSMYSSPAPYFWPRSGSGSHISNSTFPASSEFYQLSSKMFCPWGPVHRPPRSPPINFVSVYYPFPSNPSCCTLSERVAPLGLGQPTASIQMMIQIKR